MSCTELNYSARHLDFVATVFSYIIVPESIMAWTRSSEARLASFLGSSVFFVPPFCATTCCLAFVRCLPKKPGMCPWNSSSRCSFQLVEIAFIVGMYYTEHMVYTYSERFIHSFCPPTDNASCPQAPSASLPFAEDHRTSEWIPSSRSRL
jgi:hypothetical protein